MFFFRVKEYIRYLIFAGHRKGHGIHSPFIFDVVSRVFRNKTDDIIVSTVEKVRNRLLEDRSLISVNDLGSGSVKGHGVTDKRKVSDIARYSSVPKKYGILLSKLTKEFGSSSIIELGTSFGLSTLYMALSKPDAKVYTIEGCDAVASIALSNFEKAGAGNIEIHVGAFDDVLATLIESVGIPGMVFIDGNHRKDPLLRYFGIISGKSDSNTIVVIDDIYLSPEMEKAWNEIKRHKKVSVTIDLYRMGIVFFREGINSNHFVIRY
jgi:predicted O-methyltransferase YrrM